MGRKYTISFSDIACSAVQDAVSIKAGASVVFRVLEARLSQNTSTTSAQVRVRLSRLTATATLGSGGDATPDIAKHETGDAAIVSTAHTNDTTQATTSGAKSTIFEDTFNTLSGWLFVPVPEQLLVFSPGEGFALEFPAAPASADYSGSVTIEELGG